MTAPTPTRSEGIESRVQNLILIGVAAMAGAASFTHMHDWTMNHVPDGTHDWFGWANAVVSELTPIAAALEIRRRRRTGKSIWFPVAVLFGAAGLSLAAQFAMADRSFSGWLLAGVPAIAVIALTKLLLGRAPVTVPAAAVTAAAERLDVAEVAAHDRAALAAQHREPVPALPAEPFRREPVPASEPRAVAHRSEPTPVAHTPGEPSGEPVSRSLTVVAPLAREPRPVSPRTTTPRSVSPVADEPDADGDEEDPAVKDARMWAFWTAEIAAGRVPTGGQLAKVGDVSLATGKRRRQTWVREVPADLQGGASDDLSA
jgi:hypothetical protein